MKHIKYVGMADHRIIEDVDFERIGESHATVEFDQGEILELNNEISEVLLEGPYFIGEFAEVEDIKAEEKAQQEAAEEALRVQAEAERAALAAGSTGGSAGPAGPGSTTTDASSTAGNGSSTAGKAN